MSLTEKEQRDMYASIKVIEANCVTCTKCIADHETRITKLEKFNLIVVSIGTFIGTCIGFILSLFKNYQG